MVRTSSRIKPAVDYAAAARLDLGDSAESSKTSSTSGDSGDSSDDSRLDGNAEAGPSKKRGQGKRGRGGGRGGRGGKAATRARSESSGESFQGENADSEEDDDDDEDVVPSDASDPSEEGEEFDEDEDEGRGKKAAQVKGKAKATTTKFERIADRPKRRELDRYLDDDNDETTPLAMSGKAKAGDTSLKDNVEDILRSAIPLRPTGHSRLLQPPRLGEPSSIETFDDEPPRTEEELCDVTNAWSRLVNLESPWQLWEGGAWYPESYKDYKKGTAPQKDSTLIDLGLSGVGRGEPEQSYAIPQDIMDLFENTFGGSAPDLDLDIDLPDASVPFSLKPLTFQVMGDGYYQRPSVLMNAGKPVMKVAWCPMSEARSAQRNMKQYVAVMINLREFPGSSDSSETYQSCVQIWSVYEGPPPAGLAGEDDFQDEPMDEDNGDGEGMDEMGGDGTTDGPSQRKRKNPPPKALPWGGLDNAVGTCEAVIVLEEGTWTDFSWMPLGCCDDLSAGGSSKIGVISAACSDGAIRFYSITDRLMSFASGQPHRMCTTTPILAIPNDDAAALCLEWGSGSSLAVGFTNGTVRVYQDVPAMLISGKPRYPARSLTIHSNSVSSLCWMRCPQRDHAGEWELDEQPVYLLTAGFDGALVVVDLRDPDLAAYPQVGSRTNIKVVWYNFLDLAIATDNDYWAQLMRIRRRAIYTGQRVMDHTGLITSLACSDFHGMIASGGVDGAVKWANGVRSASRLGRQRTLTALMYKMDYDQGQGVYRMADNFMPDSGEVEARPLGQGRRDDGGKDRKVGRDTSIAFDPRVAVMTVAWQNGGGIGRAALFASGTASGLCRIDWLSGRMSKLS